MQYRSSLNREQLVDLAVNRYFGSVDRKNLDAVMDCFHDNAVMTIQTAFTVHAGEQAIRRMFVDFMENYTSIVHKDFTCTVDVANGRIAACFTAELEHRDGSRVVLNNTNFWRVRDDRFQEVYIYMSGENPLV